MSAEEITLDRAGGDVLVGTLILPEERADGAGAPVEAVVTSCAS